MRIHLRSKAIIATLIVIIWAGATAYAFWWFEFKSLRPFDTNSAGEIVDTDLKRLQATLLKLTEKDKSRVRVFHFWNPRCYCNRFNLSHLQGIRNNYENNEVKFYLVVGKLKKNDTKLIEKSFGAISVLEIGDAIIDIPSTPSAAVLKVGHGLTYFGPYSEGAMCSAQSGNFVELSLDATLQGTPTLQTNRIAFGCYCDLNSL